MNQSWTANLTYAVNERTLVRFQPHRRKCHRDPSEDRKLGGSLGKLFSLSTRLYMPLRTMRVVLYWFA